MNCRLVRAIAIHLVGAVLGGALAHAALAQSPVGPRASAASVGIWRGTSVCLVRPSACNDEIVVYRITPLKAADSLAIDARKIVRGQEQEMGVLGCHLASHGPRITCTIPQGVWYFTVRNDSLIGELRLRDSSRFRDVRAVRAP